MMILTRLKKIPLYLKLRLAFSLVFIGVISFFFYLRIVPCGRIVYEKSWSDKFYSGRGFFVDFRPGDRLDLQDKNSLKIIAEPLYFSIFSPRQFDNAKVKIVYEDKLSIETPIVELGLLKDETAGAYDFYPIQNSFLDKLRFSWARIRASEGKIVLQKEKNYQSEDSFWRDFDGKNLSTCQLDSLSCVAFYNYKVPTDFSLPSYTELYPLRLENDLRGGHKLYIYFNDKPGNLHLSFKPNQKFKILDSLQAEVRIYRGGLLLEAKKTVVPGKIDFSFSDAAVYKVEIIADDKVFIDSLESSSDRLVFNGWINFADIETGLNLFTNAKILSASTLETGALGSINFAGEEYFLEKTHNQITLNPKNASSINEVKSLRSDLNLSGNGVFAFNATKLFDPEIRPADRFFNPDNYQYIVANYNFPLSHGDFKEAILDVSLAGADYKDGKYSFLISIPGLSQDKGFDSSLSPANYLAIKEIKVEMTGKTLWQKIKEIYAE